MRTRRRWRTGTRLIAGVLGALVVGCTAPSPFDADPPASDDAGPDDEAAADPDRGADGPADGEVSDRERPNGATPDDGNGDDAPGAPESDGTPDPEARACNDAVVVAASETIDRQIDALGAADFEAALTFASRRFQAEVEPAIFEAIIVAQYPILLDEPEAEFGRCAQVEDLARIEVTVIATDGARDALLYLLVREEGRWSIDGATSVDEPAREFV